ncbi:hypothetical protein V9T40_012237 [Parthenolecanium corni]|uniref:F-box domain-containing protein n=1 Tax=Parthenolecanium corni TaxID=536013 RepID=A0AAN9T8I0_9HEMI
MQSISVTEVHEFPDVLFKLKNLEELTIHGNQFLSFKIKGPDVFLKQMPKITVLNLSSIPSDVDIEDIFEQILDSAPNLQVLRLNFSTSFTYTQLHIKQLLSSKLKKLHLIFDYCIYKTYGYYKPAPKFEQPLPINCTLEELVIFGWASSSLFSDISPYLRNLRYLALAYPEDLDLQTVYKNHVNLEFLKITNMNLELMECTTPLVFTLPKLKRLELRILHNEIGIQSNRSFVNNLVKVITKLRLLEVLDLRIPSTNFKLVEKLVTALKNMRYFELDFTKRVLLEVFKYVASRDRRNSIRLVCRRWNRLADDQIVANDEWIVVHCQHLDRHNELLPLEQAPLTAIAHYIQTHSNKLKKLWLVQPNSSLPPTDEPMEFSTILSELKNLEELAVTGKQFLNFDKQMPELFLKRMPKLTVLILSQIPISGRNSCVEILNEILDILPNLQVLLFESDEHILKFDEFLIEKILSSKLKRLHLLRCWIYVDHEERNNHLRVHSVNRTLEELVIIPTTELVSVYNPSEILNIMLQYCKNLRYVAISHPDEEVVQNVFKYHNNKHEPSFINDLIQALRKNTRLEAVELHVRIESDLPETAIKQLLSSLKKLRYFTLTYKLENGFSQGQSIVEKIQDFFEVCPSLRYIVYQRRYFSRFRTPTNGYEIKEVSRSCVKPDKPRELCPDWYSLCKYEPGMYSNLDGIGNEHL